MDKLEVLNSILNEKIDNEDCILKDLISDENIDVLTKYIEFFENIPNENIYEVFGKFLTLIFEYEKAPYFFDIDKINMNIEKEVLTELRNEEIEEMIKDIEENSKNASEDNIKELINIKKTCINEYYDKKIEKLKPKKPSLVIKDDLSTIKNYQMQIEKFQQMVERLYGAKSKINDELIFINIPKEMKDTYYKNKTIIEDNKKLIDDLENQNFKIISKYNYYEIENPSKTPIQEYLKSIRKKYSLKNVSEIEKDLRYELKKK